MATPTQSEQRTTLLRKNIFGSFLIKGWSAVVVLLMVPLTLNCLGEYKNGVWLTISSMLVWIENMDIGLGNGLRNQLTAHLAHGDTTAARSLVSSAFAMLTAIMLPTMLILTLLVLCTDTYGLLNVAPQRVEGLDQVLVATIVLVCTTFILKLIGNFYMGLQLPAVSNLLVAGGQTLALAATWLVWRSGSHSIMHVALAATASPLAVYLLAYPWTFHHRYPQLRPSLRMATIAQAKAVMTMGVKFFIMQMSSIILFMSANILISHLFTPAMVTPYQVAYRYFSIMLVAFTVVCMPYWNATTDAWERGDVEWIRRATKRLNLMTLAIFATMTLMVVVAEPVYAHWVPGLHVERGLTIAMAAYIFIIIYSMRYSYFINGIGKLWLQLVFTTAAAIAFIPLAWLAARLTGDITGFLATMCLINLPGLVANRIQFQKLITGKAKGIWNK